MKVLSFYAGPPRGGCYERLVRLHGALASRGATVHALIRNPPESRANLQYHALAGAPGPLTLPRLLLGAVRASQVARREEVDGLLAFGSMYAALMLPFRGRRRLVTFLRGNWPEQERTQGASAARVGLVRRLEARVLRSSDRVLAVSGGVAPAGIETTVIPNDVRPPRLIERSAARANLGLPQGVFIAGSLSALTPIKSVETLIEAVTMTRRAVHVAASGFGASTPYETLLRDRSKDLIGEGRAHLLGWLDRDAFLSAIDVLVVCSRHEGSPNGLLEGLAAGLPCIGARVPGVEETLGNDAMLFPFGDPGALSARIDELEASEQLRSSLSLRSRERARAYSFDWDEVASNSVLDALRERTSA